MNNKKIVLLEKMVRRNRGVVVLPVQEYKRLCESAMPNYYLTGRKAKELDKLVEQGVEEYQRGKCKIIKSLADLD